MLLDTPADIAPDAPARAGRMMRFARAVRMRWRTLFLVTGAVLTVLGVVLASGAVLLPGILLLLCGGSFGPSGPVGDGARVKYMIAHGAGRNRLGSERPPGLRSEACRAMSQ
jgi:hypothetical protein